MSTKEAELESASRHFGLKLTKRSVRQQEMFVAIYKYNEGWIDEEGLEIKLLNIFKQRR